nr:MAG TPA: hypothetical protein [Caudoviricetes sp.]
MDAVKYLKELDRMCRFPATSRFALNNYQEGEERLEACNQACVYGALWRLKSCGAVRMTRSCPDGCVGRRRAEKGDYGGGL